MENEIVIHSLNKLIDFGKVNELQAIVDVAQNAITAINDLTRERDAAVRDLEYISACRVCAKRAGRNSCNINNCIKAGRMSKPSPEFKWRGVCEENSGGKRNDEG